MTNNNFQRVKAAADLEAVVRAFAPQAELKWQGPRLQGFCPLHNEKTPSFTVKDERFKCYGCRRSGDIFDFVRQLYAVDAFEALRILSERFGVQIEGRPQDAIIFPSKGEREQTPIDTQSKAENAVQGKLGPFAPRFLKPEQVVPTLNPERRQGNTLFEYLSRLYGAKAVNRVFDLFGIGIDGDRVCFWHTDAEGRTRFGQKVVYPEGSHYRLRNIRTPVITVHPPSGMDPCFFGEQQLAAYPDAIVCIVESGKAAMAGTFEDPCKVWIATGGKNYLSTHNPQKWEVLKGRKIVLYPDLEKPAKDGGPPPPPLWEQAVPELQKLGFDVSVNRTLQYLNTPAERLPDGADIADLYFNRRERALLIPQDAAEPPPPAVQAPTAGPPPITAETVKDAREKLEQVADRWPEHSEILRRFGSQYLDHFADFATGRYFGRKPEPMEHWWKVIPESPLDWEARWWILWEVLGEAFPFEGKK